MPFKFKKLSIKGVILVKPVVYHDNRGFFMETYKLSDFKKAGINADFIQENHSRSKYGVLRGLHFQKGKYAQAKLVRCIRGIVYDVAVDLRKNSPTFGKYVGVILSEHNNYMLYIPRGFAHGFLTLSDWADVLYKVDNLYSPENEGGIIWNDPEINISWPIEEPLLSEKDSSWPTLKELIREGVIFE